MSCMKYWLGTYIHNCAVLVHAYTGYLLYFIHGCKVVATYFTGYNENDMVHLAATHCVLSEVHQMLIRNSLHQKRTHDAWFSHSNWHLKPAVLGSIPTDCWPKSLESLDWTARLVGLLKHTTCNVNIGFSYFGRM